MSGIIRCKNTLGALCLITAVASFPVMVSAYTIKVVERHLFGPGPFPDQKLQTAWIRHLELANFLNGTVKGFNNREREPNVSGEARQGKTVDGQLSDSTLINENIDMGNAIIMNGQFNLLLAAVYGGPNQGDTHFYLDKSFNWWIKDDIAIDPGFDFGVVKINDFTFSTSPRVIPYSAQTARGYPGGTDQIGSTEAGRVAMGGLGDKNMDGYLDGVFNAIGLFPIDSMFLPGAPFVQSFGFESDIPISATDAALLTVANARSILALARRLQNENASHPDIGPLFEEAFDRLRTAVKHIDHATAAQATCSPECEQLRSARSTLLPALAADRKESVQRDAVRVATDRAFDLLKAVHDEGRS